MIMGQSRYGSQQPQQGSQGGYQNPFGSLSNSFASIFSGLFGDSGDPYKQAADQYQKYYGQAAQYQQPFYEAGVGALPGYQAWLAGQQDPSGFINNLMGQYQQSPYAKYQTQQGLQGAQNAASAGGLLGSTALSKFNQQQAQGISSQDMQSWLPNVLGITAQNAAGIGESLLNSFPSQFCIS